MPYPPRRAALRALLREAAPALDALLVTDLVNVRYLTGFTGSNAALLVHADGDDASRVLHRRPLPHPGRARGARPAAARRAGQRPRRSPRPRPSTGCTRSASSPTTSPSTPTPSWPRRPTGVALHRAPGLVQRLRTVKDEAEVAALRAACAAADAALADLLAAGGLRPGRTEREVALDLEDRMREHGATGPAFDTIVAAGPNSAVPHHRPDATGCAAATW